MVIGQWHGRPSTWQSVAFNQYIMITLSQPLQENSMGIWAFLYSIARAILVLHCQSHPGTPLPEPSWYSIARAILVLHCQSHPGTPLPEPSWYSIARAILVLHCQSHPGTPLPEPSWYSIARAILVLHCQSHPGTPLPEPSWYSIARAILVLIVRAILVLHCQSHPGTLASLQHHIYSYGSSLLINNNKDSRIYSESVSCHPTGKSKFSLGTIKLDSEYDQCFV